MGLTWYNKEDWLNNSYSGETIWILETLGEIGDTEGGSAVSILLGVTNRLDSSLCI